MSNKILAPVAEGFKDSIRLAVGLSVGLVISLAQVSYHFINHSMQKSSDNPNQKPSLHTNSH